MRNKIRFASEESSVPTEATLERRNPYLDRHFVDHDSLLVAYISWYEAVERAVNKAPTRPRLNSYPVLHVGNGSLLGLVGVVLACRFSLLGMALQSVPRLLLVGQHFHTHGPIPCGTTAPKLLH